MKRVCVVLLLAVALLPLPVTAQGDGPGITSPAPNDVLSGTVAITGTADHPAFASYTVDYRFAPEGAALGEWLAISPLVPERVFGGLLVTWDTTTVENGPYQLRLTIRLTNGSELYYPVAPLTVDNAAGGSGGGLDSGQMVLAFQSNADGDYELYHINADGSARVQLTDNSSNDVHPAWSPDGLRLLFASDRDGNQEIYVMDADGTHVRRLTTNTSDEWAPAWSPDGAQIAYYSNADGNYDIYVMNANGTNPRNLTDNDADNRSPAWSPDGSQIVYYSDAGSGSALYIMNADGSNSRLLTTLVTGDALPDWSPDGSQIVFDSGRDGNREIYLMNADGSDQTRLTVDDATDWDAAFAPDGGQIAFVSRRSDTADADIYIMAADGSGVRNLTNMGDSDEFAPVWRPVGGGGSAGPSVAQNRWVATSPPPAPTTSARPGRHRRAASHGISSYLPTKKT